MYPKHRLWYRLCQQKPFMEAQLNELGAIEPVFDTITALRMATSNRWTLVRDVDLPTPLPRMD